MSSLPVTMAQAASSGLTPLHRGLPDEIAIWEILVRLPPKALLRCRAVCRAWRQATSTRDFLLTHHTRQPTLPLLSCYGCGGDNGSLDIIPLDQQAGVAADQPQSIARLADIMFDLKASCDGLLVLSVLTKNLHICNPATRQYAPLRQLDGFIFLGMYTHTPTGEYRLLLYPDPWLMRVDLQYGSYIFTLGSGQPPRHIGFLDAKKLIVVPLSVMFHGNLHWHLEQRESTNNKIMVFDTTAESFRQMHAPEVPGCIGLFEMGGMLSMSGFSDAAAVVDIWVMQDYEHEVWAFKYRVELPVAEIRVQFPDFGSPCRVVAAPWDGDVLVLVKSCEWLLHVDVHGKLVARFHRRGLGPTQLGLKQTLVSHTFFPTLQGYVVNAKPFI